MSFKLNLRIFKLLHSNIMLTSHTFSDSFACPFAYYPMVPPTETYRTAPPLLPFIQPSHNASNGVNDNNTTLDGLSQSHENDFVIDKPFLKGDAIAFIQDSPCGTSKVLFQFLPSLAVNLTQLTEVLWHLEIRFRRFTLRSLTTRTQVCPL